MSDALLRRGWVCHARSPHSSSTKIRVRIAKFSAAVYCRGGSRDVFAVVRLVVVAVIAMAVVVAIVRAILVAVVVLVAMIEREGRKKEEKEDEWE